MRLYDRSNLIEQFHLHPEATFSVNLQHIPTDQDVLANIEMTRVIESSCLCSGVKLVVECFTKLAM